MSILSIEDVRGPTWRKVREYAEDQLRGLRTNLESDLTPERTAKVRGQIRSFNLLLALENTQAPIAEEEEDD